jgi:hypothetical protein
LHPLPCSPQDIDMQLIAARRVFKLETFSICFL